MNGDEMGGANRPITAVTNANPFPGEGAAYDDAAIAVKWARMQREIGYDPTRGATHFNLQNGPGRRPFAKSKTPIVTQSGPFNSLFPTTGPNGVDASNVYVNTYETDP